MPPTGHRVREQSVLELRDDDATVLLNRRQLLGSCFAGALGIAVAQPRGLGLPIGTVVATIKTRSTMVLPPRPSRTAVELFNSSGYNLYVTEGALAWLRSGQLLRPGEQLVTSYPGPINAIVEAYGYHLATGDLIVGPR